jgi:NADH-quinone oxidoreductase subunit M
MNAVILASEQIHFPLLTALVLLPGIGAAVVALTPGRRPDVARIVGLLFAIATFAITIFLLVQFKTHPHLAATGVNGLDHAEGFQFIDRAVWLKQWGISWHLGLDGISLWLVVMTGFLFPIGMLGAPAHHDSKAFTGWLLLLEFGCLGTFVALDLFVFFVMFEIVLVPMYFLIVGWGYAERKYAATKFFLYTMFGSAFMLVAMVALVVLSSHQSGHVTFDLIQIVHTGGIARTTARWLFLGFAIAFAVKVPLFPVHTWLPDAHTQAPTAGSIILAGVMLKLGTYGLLRFGLYLFPEASVYFGPLLVTLGVIGIIYGAITAAMQKDLKRVIAYSSVAHLGFIALGLFAITKVSITGAVYQMLNHGISTPALFLLVGYIYERRHTRDFTKLRGLQKSAPILAAAFIFVTFSSIGLPGLNGFVGEFLILVGSFPTRRWWVVVAAIGVILAAVYLLWAFQRVFHGMPDEDNADTPDLNWSERTVMGVFVVIILFMGLYPRPILDRIQPAVQHLVTHVEQKTTYREPKVGVLTVAHGTDTGTEHGEGHK